MQYAELMELLGRSDPSDWVRVREDYHVFKEDVSFRIERLDDEHPQEFYEEWANRHPDPKASRVRYHVYYGCTLVAERLLVMVDGGRAELPLPRSRDELVIGKADYNFASLVDMTGRLDEYLKRSGIQVVS